MRPILLPILVLPSLVPLAAQNTITATTVTVQPNGAVILSGSAVSGVVVTTEEKAEDPKATGEAPADPKAAEAKGTDPKAAKPKPAQPLVSLFTRQRFSRTPASILAASAEPIAVEPKKPAAGKENSEENQTEPPVLIQFKRSFALGDWPAVGKFFSTAFEKPEDAAQAYQYLLENLLRARERNNNDNENNGGNGGAGALLGESNVLTVNDILGLADASPAVPTPEVTASLGQLLTRTLARGDRLEPTLPKLRSGTVRLGGTDPVARLNAARLLLAAGQALPAGEFLPDTDFALAAKNAAALNLRVQHLLAVYESEHREADLEQAWALAQEILSLDAIPGADRLDALRAAIDLAPRVRPELGDQWLAGLFTANATLGAQIFAALGGFGSANANPNVNNENGNGNSRVNPDPDARLRQLKLASRIVSALVVHAPARADEWRASLGALALNWINEARFSEQKDTSTRRGPAPKYDRYGNFYFSGDDEDMPQRYNNGRRELQPIRTSELLDIIPTEGWVARLEAGPRLSLWTQIAVLNLKVGDADAAFPFIEKTVAALPSEGKELAARFLEVWTDRRDPNNERRRTNRYMYAYGYNPGADAIPLTRSQQVRNLTELAGCVTRLRALPGEKLEDEHIIKSFIRLHGPAEVFQLKDIEAVFGNPATLPAKTIAALAQTMRTNLLTVWRNPKTQQDAKTKRTDKETLNEVRKGYLVVDQLLEEGVAAHPKDWRLTLATAAVSLDELNFANDSQRTSDYSTKRASIYEVFARAAALYAESLPQTPEAEQSGEVYTQWFYAGLGASDLPAVKNEQSPALAQFPLIKAAIAALPKGSSERHLEKFANTLVTRLNSVAAELKHRYLSAGLQIAGDQERARPAKDLMEFYQDLVTEVRLQTTIDGSDRVGHGSPFGIQVDLLHTAAIEREAGGFSKYLINQNSGGYYYNFGRPPENYRDKFEEALRGALSENFDIKSVTFANSKVKSRPGEQEGWRVTPFAYVLLQPKGAQVDQIPGLSLNLDFLDTTGFVILPIGSSPVGLDARPDQGDPRPVTNLEIKQTLDERQAPEGRLILEVSASAKGLVPDLKDLLDLAPAGFELTKTDNPGVNVTTLDVESEDEHRPVSTRSWTLTYQAKESSARPKTFTFGTGKIKDAKVTRFRYADADLEEVAATVDLNARYGKNSLMPVLLGAVSALVATPAFLLWRRRRGQSAVTVAAAPAFALPLEVNPLTIRELLRRISASGLLNPNQQEQIEKDLGLLDSQFYAPNATAAGTDLEELARAWLAKLA